MLWITVHHQTFAEKLLEKLAPPGVAGVLPPLDVFQHSFDRSDLVLVETPELCWADYKMARYLLQRNYPKVVAIGYLRPSHAMQTLWEMGIHGFIDDEHQWEEFVGILQEVQDGKRVAPRLKEQAAAEAGSGSPKSLSEAEIEVIYWICKDFTSKQISQLTNKSVRTVDNIRYKLYKRLGVKGTAGLVKWAFDNQLAHPSLGPIFFSSVLQEDNAQG